MKNTLLFITQILILTQLVISQKTCNGILSTSASVCNSKGLCIAQNKCSCYSGYSGQYCSIMASNACKWHNISKLSTNQYPTIDLQKTKFENDTLKIAIKSEIVKDRLYTQVFMINKTNPDCTYPGQYWNQGFDNTGTCANIYNGNTPWIKGKKCGWIKNETDTEIKYTGNVYIDQVESLGEMRGQKITRDIRSVIPFLIRFQKVIEVSYDVKVFSPIAMLAAVVNQQYIPGPPSAGLVEFITQLQYPFIIDEDNTIEVISSPNPLVATSKLSIDSQECLQGQACTQKWSSDLITNGACSFTGKYEYKLKIKCHPLITNPADCPLSTTGNNTAIVQIDINSEDFCTKAEIDIKLIGNLKSYEDSALTIEKNSFLQDSTVYFKATVGSTQATLKTSTIKRVQLIKGNKTNILYDGTITTFGTNVAFALTTGTANTAPFNFKYSEQFTPVPADSSEKYKVTALVEVEYAAIENNNQIQSKIQEFHFERNQIQGVTAAQQDGSTADKYELSNSLISGTSITNSNGYFLILIIFILFQMM